MDRKIISNFQDLTDLIQELADKENNMNEQIDDLLYLSKILQNDINLINSELKEKDVELKSVKSLNETIENVIEIIKKLKS